MLRNKLEVAATAPTPRARQAVDTLWHVGSARLRRARSAL